jgi:hypothetical protein
LEPPKGALFGKKTEVAERLPFSRRTPAGKEESLLNLENDPSGLGVPKGDLPFLEKSLRDLKERFFPKGAIVP